eukprot:TRINITY_DN5160_c0_g2_i2.p4 TRINITY_DN5160_c0_g2~~TRINITY_DN5160_c0_g2_i2.p4  ORF type:complete len:291 (+),score=61.38 TRINITY_DN5160_c0_g2_i2:47-919(+)
MLSWTGKVQHQGSVPLWGCGRYDRNGRKIQKSNRYLISTKLGVAGGDAGAGGLNVGANVGVAGTEVQGGDTSQQQMPQIEVFPRIGESDPYRVLGISTEADFEEVQDARNFLYDQYKQEERSREKIEWAFDKILSQKYSDRHKLGFRPPRRGKRGEAQGQPKQNILEKFKNLLEPDVPTSTLINEGVIYFVLAAWAAIQVKDPTLPLLGGFIYCTYKVFQKRQQRNPDGPFLGGSPFFGALGAAMLSLVIGGLFIGGLIPAIIPRAMLPPLSAVNFFLVSCLGVVAIFFK